MTGLFPILQMGMSYPADVLLVQEFSALCRNIIVIEERRSFLEKNIRDELFHTLGHAEAGELSSRIFGKTFPGGQEGIPETRGLNYSVLAQKLIPLFQATEQIPPQRRNGRLSAELGRLRWASKPKLEVFNQKVVLPHAHVLPRLPPSRQLRGAARTAQEFRRSRIHAAGTTRQGPSISSPTATPAATPCSCSPRPNSSCTITAAWASAAAPARESTRSSPTSKSFSWATERFSIPARSPSATRSRPNQDITYIILENKTTAMTGHQEHAGTELDVLGNRSYIQDIEQIVRAHGRHQPADGRQTLARRSNRNTRPPSKRRSSPTA